MIKLKRVRRLEIGGKKVYLDLKFDYTYCDLGGNVWVFNSANTKERMIVARRVRWKKGKVKRIHAPIVRVPV